MMFRSRPIQAVQRSWAASQKRSYDERERVASLGGFSLSALQSYKGPNRRVTFLQRTRGMRRRNFMQAAPCQRCNGRFTSSRAATDLLKSIRLERRQGGDHQYTS